MIISPYCNITHYYRHHIIKVAQHHYNLDDTLYDYAITLEPPRNEAHGDLSTNIAMLLAKPLKQKPVDIAERICALLEGHDDIATIDIAGPGFINFSLKPHIWQQIIPYILEKKLDYGNLNDGQAEKINVEYISANPTGPMHIAHARGAVIGDVLASIYAKCGYDVTREYYINDAGSQIALLARSVYYRYSELLQQAPSIMPDNLYPGTYLIPVAQDIINKDGVIYLDMAEDDYLPIFRQYAVDAMMAIIKDDVRQLHIFYDVFTSEYSLHHKKMIEATISELRQDNLIYCGVLEQPKSDDSDDWEEREQLLFRATQYGDDTDRALQKSNGEWTYFAADIAYHLDKFRRGFHRMVNIFGADHAGYIKRMVAATKAVTHNQATLSIVTAQIVRFIEHGKPIKMSKRSGKFVTLRDLIERIGPDAIRVYMLSRKADSMLDFDLQHVLDHNKDNPVFYLHYAHARTFSVMRMACEVFGDILADDIMASYHAHHADYIKPDEYNLLKKMAFYPRMLSQAAQYNEPHRVLLYLLELSTLFHALWTKGREDDNYKIVDVNNKEKTYVKLALLFSFRYVLQSGAQVIGCSLEEKL